MRRNIDHLGPDPTSEQIRSALLQAHLVTNEAIHLDGGIEDGLAGTTAVSVLFLEERMFISNVGDSRCVIASIVDGRLVGKPLSNDQTPYRKDERERIKKYGARILSMVCICLYEMYMRCVICVCSCSCIYVCDVCSCIYIYMHIGVYVYVYR